MTFRQAKMFQTQIALGSLPISLLLVGNKTEGKVVFVKVRPVGLIVENATEETEVVAVFAEDGFSFGKPGWLDEQEDFNYDTLYDYKNIPLMLKWLQQQKLQQPA